MREAQFNTEVVHSIKKLGWYCFKLPDMPASVVIGLRFVPEKPCDIMACIEGKMVGIEGKQLKKYEAFGLRHLRDNQVETLDYVLSCEGRSFVFLNIRQKRCKETGTSHLNRLIILDWLVWGERIKAGDSIKKAELETLPYVEGKCGIFDLMQAGIISRRGPLNWGIERDGRKRRT